MSIKEELQKLKENDLRKKIVIPYLKVCFPYVEDWHGSAEKGKDIIYITWDKVWNSYIVGAVVIKNDGDIKMSGSSNRNIRILHSQLMQTLKEPITFPIDPSQTRFIEKIKFLTSYNINKPARDFINLNVNPHIVKFIPGNKFEEIIQCFIKDKNNEFNKNYEFNCNTFESFCTDIPYPPKIIEETKRINLETEARRISHDSQFEN